MTSQSAYRQWMKGLKPSEFTHYTEHGLVQAAFEAGWKAAMEEVERLRSIAVDIPPHMRSTPKGNQR